MGFKFTRPSRSDAEGSRALIYVNFVWRLLQFLIGLGVLIVYVIQPSYTIWKIFDEQFKFSLGVAAGAIALATTPFLAVIPFFFGYKFVAWAFVWDFIVMAIYAATFAYFRAHFPYGSGSAKYRREHYGILVDDAHWNAMHAGVYLDLVGMLLWLITFLMAVGVLAFGCVRGRGVKH